MGSSGSSCSHAISDCQEPRSSGQCRIAVLRHMATRTAKTSSHSPHPTSRTEYGRSTACSRTRHGSILRKASGQASYVRIEAIDQASGARRKSTAPTESHSCAHGLTPIHLPIADCDHDLRRCGSSDRYTMQRSSDRSSFPASTLHSVGAYSGTIMVETCKCQSSQ